MIVAILVFIVVGLLGLSTHRGSHHSSPSTFELAKPIGRCGHLGERFVESELRMEIEGGVNYPLADVPRQRSLLPD